MRDDDEPAFPRDHAHDGHNGMSLRDWFAGMAMQGILAGDHPITHERDCMNTVAAAAWEQADAMLRARREK